MAAANDNELVMERRLHPRIANDHLVLILAGASALQAAASREALGHGRMRATKPQEAPGGLFAPRPAHQHGLFDGAA